MSLFSRAYDAALSVGGISRTQAANIAGIHGSVISRLMNGETSMSPEHVEALLRAISDPGDKEHCLIEYLKDCCPDEYRDRLVIHFGAVLEARSKNHDRVNARLVELDRLATQNESLNDLLDSLIKLLGK